MPRKATPKPSPPTLKPYQVEEVDLAALHSHPQNYRDHTADQLAHLQQSLQDFGVYKNIVIARDNTILAGHGLVEAGKQLGLTSLPVKRMDLDPQEEQALRLLVGDNETARLAIMQEQALADLLHGLAASPGGLLGTGFDAEALAALTQQAVALAAATPLHDVEPQLDRAEALREQWGVELGQLWQLGRHRVLCGDCTEQEQVERLLEGARPMLMVTDPPYGVQYDPAWRNEAAAQGKIGDAASRVATVTNDDRVDWSDAWRLFPGDVAYTWSPPGDHVILTGLALQSAGYVIRNQIIWRKPHLPISRGHYAYQHEPCWYAVKKHAPAHWIGDVMASTLWDITLDRNVAGGHSTQKPLECMARPIRNHEAPEVYDPFLGSGTTLIACEQLGRHCYGLEIAPAYVAVTLQRWADLTDQTPQHLP